MPALRVDGGNLIKQNVKESIKSGFDFPTLEALLAKMQDGTVNVHAILIERNGQVVMEQYRHGLDRSIYSPFPRMKQFDSTTLHDMRSIGKSIIGLLLGIVLGQGKIQSVHAPVLDFYPEHADLVTPDLKNITLEHLLTMSSGLAWQEGDGFPDNEHHLYWKSSPTRYVLSRKIIHAPGETFNYNSGGTAVLADILTRVTKTPWHDLVHTYLFEPLDIEDLEWIMDLHGRPMAFTGLRLCPQDMIKLGRLVLNHGQWQGRQVVPADWIAASLQTRMSTGFNELQYGYHWWAGSLTWHQKEITWAGAFGNGGQRIYILPELDMTVVITAGAYGDPQISRTVHKFFKELVMTVKS